MRRPEKMLGINFSVLNYPQCFSKVNIKFNQAPAYIAHYVYQSEETYRRRKINLIGDDGSVRGNMGKEIHKNYNDVVNLQPQKYVKNIKDLLNYYS
jgi:hypothetical protein